MRLKVHRGQAGRSSDIDLQSSAKIHIMGVCGTAMSSLAGLLKESGYNVSGSDRQFYPPVSEQLKQLNIKTFKGFNAENLQADIDLVVVGNVVSKNMPEAQALLENNLPYVSLPEILNALIIQNKKTVMATGTHGKTTVSFLTTWLLDQCGLKPGFMIGGVSENFKKSFCLQKNSDWFVVEGDEYDIAFFEKTPKFLHYPATHTILTGIEFDHADIYKDIGEVEQAFRLLLEKQTPSSVLIACVNCPRVKKLISQKSSKPQILTYGTKEGDYRLIDRKTFAETGGQVIKVQGPDQTIDIQIPLNGEHNALNALSVWVLSQVLYLPKERVLSAFKSFKGVRRRFQVLGVFNGVALIEDFAHHPSAVSAVIQSTREAYPGHRILTLFEPRSNTSRKNIFQQEYEKTLQQSDLVFCRSVQNTTQTPESELFSAQNLAKSINQKYSMEKAFFAEDVGALTRLVQRNVKEGDIILILSNGDFGGIYSLLKEALS